MHFTSSLIRFLKLARVLSLKTVINADETRVIVKEGETLWVKSLLEVPSVMIVLLQKAKLFKLVKYSLNRFSDSLNLIGGF